MMAQNCRIRRPPFAAGDELYRLVVHKRMEQVVTREDGPTDWDDRERHRAEI